MVRTTHWMCRFRLGPRLLAVALLAGPLAAAPAGHTLAETLAKMDEAAAHFKSFGASMRHLSHFDAIHEEDTESGVVQMKRVKPKELHVRLDLDKPEQKVIVTNGSKVEIYYPRSGQVDRYELGHKRSLVDMFMAQGFGGTSADLARDYTVTLGGPDSVEGESATRVELIPKSQVMLEEYQKVYLWISDKSGYTVQQKFYEKNGKDYHVITYTNVKINPEISESSFKLDVPKGTQRETVLKK